jgi:hypothetical protein
VAGAYGCRKVVTESQNGRIGARSLRVLAEMVPKALFQLFR